jgi:lysophospholipase L1-like esterase
MPTEIKNGETILFIGDSITDCGRRDPQHAPLGCGYVQMVADMLTIREPQKKIAVINRGIGGNTIADLRDRWHDDVFEIKPDWLSVKIGINDLNRTLEGNADLPAEKFEKIYASLLAQTVERLPNCQLLLIDPFFMSLDQTEDSYRARVLRTLPGYIDVVHRLSRRYKTRLVKTHDLFQEQLKHHTLEIFSTEPVHPNSAGHLLIAEAVYKSLSK